MTNPTIDHPVWGAVEVLQDGGSWVLCQVGADTKKVSKAWLLEKGVVIEHLFKEPEAPSRPRQKSSASRKAEFEPSEQDEDFEENDSEEEPDEDEDLDEDFD